MLRRAWGDIPVIACSWVGINAALNLVTNLIARGILDPTKVERVALLNAASLAGLLLATEVLVAEEPEAEAAVHMHEQYTAGLTGRFFPPVKRS